jgi:tRNA(adenine34) deaminase
LNCVCRSALTAEMRSSVGESVIFRVSFCMREISDMNRKLFSVGLLFATFGILCLQAQEGGSLATLKNMTMQDERNNILALVAADYVFQDWQEEGHALRGYNIGAVLYDPAADTIVGVSRNSVYREADKTQHAEMELMQGYIHKRYCGHPNETLRGLQIVTTLEPCMMCAGMITFLEVDTVKYIQTDPNYGKNIERLATEWVDSLGVHYPANERNLHTKSVSLARTTYLAAFLNKGYEKYRERDPKKSMAGYLQTAKARRIFESADRLLKQWRLIYPENQKLLDSAYKTLGITSPNENKLHTRSANYDLFLQMWKSIE